MILKGNLKEICKDIFIGMYAGSGVMVRSAGIAWDLQNNTVSVNKSNDLVVQSKLRPRPK